MKNPKTGIAVIICPERVAYCQGSTPEPKHLEGLLPLFFLFCTNRNTMLFAFLTVFDLLMSK
jgi:hypothetical protein